MTALDGRDLESALDSLAAAARVERAELVAALIGYDESRVESGENESPMWRIPREVLGQIGVDVDALHFENAYHFHGTRVIDPANIRSRGLLPLDQMVEDIWLTLHELVRNELASEQWSDFRESVEEGAGGHWGHLYRMKTRDRIHFGPHGVFVREVLLKPGDHSHDYLGNPEIVEDIARCYDSVFAGDLENRYREAATPCIATFLSERVEPSAVNSVFWFAFNMLREGVAGMAANGGIALNGEVVPPERIVAIDVAEPVPGEERVYRLR